MLQQFARTLRNQCNPVKFTQAFSTHHEIPSKLQKVEQVTIKFNIKNAKGQWEQIHAFQGQSVLDAIEKAQVKGFDSANLCYGHDYTYRTHQRPLDPFTSGPACGFCRIILKDNWFQRVKQQTGSYVANEEWLLLSRPDHREDIRLSCCLPVQKWMEGCTFEILPDTEVSQITKVQ